MTVSPLLVVADAGGADPDPRVAIGKALVHCAVFLIFGFSRKKCRQNPKICEIVSFFITYLDSEFFRFFTTTVSNEK